MKVLFVDNGKTVMTCQLDMVPLEGDIVGDGSSRYRVEQREVYLEWVEISSTYRANWLLTVTKL